MEEKNTKRKSLRERIGPDFTTFVCVMPKDLHKIVKMHALIRNETANNWIIRCIVEQIEREKAYL